MKNQGVNFISRDLLIWHKTSTSRSNAYQIFFLKIQTPAEQTSTGVNSIFKSWECLKKTSQAGLLVKGLFPTDLIENRLCSWNVFGNNAQVYIVRLERAQTFDR